MPVEAKNNTSIFFLLRAIKVWIIAAATLVVAFSAATFFAGLDGVFLGYASSAASFLSCLTAGAAAHRERGGGALYTGLVCGAIIAVALLTVGFVIAGFEMEPSGIISVSTFSVAGSCCGSAFFGRKSRVRTTKTGKKAAKNWK